MAKKTNKNTDNRLRQLPERGRNDGRPSSYRGNEAVRGRERNTSLQARIAKRRKNLCAPVSLSPHASMRAHTGVCPYTFLLPSQRKVRVFLCNPCLFMLIFGADYTD